MEKQKNYKRVFSCIVFLALVLGLIAPGISLMSASAAELDSDVVYEAGSTYPQEDASVEMGSDYQQMNALEESSRSALEDPTVSNGIEAENSSILNSMGNEDPDDEQSTSDSQIGLESSESPQNSEMDSNSEKPLVPDEQSKVETPGISSNDPENNDDASSQTSREAIEFNANDFIKELIFSLTSDDQTEVYSLKSFEELDTEEAFPDGISRSAFFAGTISFNTQVMAETQGSYPLVPGDSITCTFPAILQDNDSMSGRLRDATTIWDASHEGVGDYKIENGKLTIKFDDGYIEETRGKILSSAIKFNGSFEWDEQEEGSFVEDLKFGSATLRAKFKKLDVKRNLSIGKAGITYGYSESPYFSYGDSYPQRYTAKVDDSGYINYVVEVHANDDNTYKLTNVKVTDLFDEATQKKVNLSTITLTSVKNAGQTIALDQVEPIHDSDGYISGWNIGDLGIGKSATIRFKVQLKKEQISEAVEAEKGQRTDTSAEEARTLRNTASAIADRIDEPVQATFSMPVKNYVTISKRVTNFDLATLTQNFTTTITVPKRNPYTVYNVPIYDYLDSSIANHCEKVGITSVQVKHDDGTTEALEYSNFTQPNIYSWKATLVELRPGDVVTLESYVTLKNSVWDRRDSEGVTGGVFSNRIDIGRNINASNVYANDLNHTYAYASFDLRQTHLSKSASAIRTNGTVDWTIKGNLRKDNVPTKDISGTKIIDTLGPNLAFVGNATVTFYNNDGQAGSETLELDPSESSFTFIIPQEYGTCEYRISYTTRITDWDDYYGPEKNYKNTVTDGVWTIVKGTETRSRSAAMLKLFVKQEKDWAEWKTEIYSELEAGDTYTDTCTDGINRMYFTQENLDGISLSIAGVELLPSLYRINAVDEGSADGKYQSYVIEFLEEVKVEKEGMIQKPSKKSPLVLRYRTTMINPSYGVSWDYNNAGTLKAGPFTDSDKDYCRRKNDRELLKSVDRVANGYIDWKVRANYWGYSGQPDGTAILTDVLPKGVEFVEVKKDESVSSSYGKIESVDVQKNEDGTTTLTIRLSGLRHYEVSKNVSDYNGSVEFKFFVKARIIDEAYLYGSPSGDFSFTNNISLNDRYGNPKSDSSTATVSNKALQKGVIYNEATAPYAHFEIEVNPTRLDLNPAGDTVEIVDQSSDNLLINPASLTVVEGATGNSVDFSIDASGIETNTFVIRVPDNTYVKIRYQAQVNGFQGEEVDVENSVWFKGKKSYAGHDGHLSRRLKIVASTGLAESEPMIWLAKRDENANLIAGATFRLSRYDQAENAWKLVYDDIRTMGAAQSNRGTKIESLEIDTLYKLEETTAPNGYVLDLKPHYFVLFKDSEPAVTYPEELEAEKIFKGPSGSLIPMYNKPYSIVNFAKTDSDGVLLEGAELEIRVGSVNGPVALDQEGRECVFTSSAEHETTFSLAPGTYALLETKAPLGYLPNVEPIEFIVMGDKDRQVQVDGETVNVVSIINSSSKLSVSVQKVWHDTNNMDGTRPSSVTIQLLKNGEIVEGQEIALNETNNWQGSFDDLDAYQAGEKIVYSLMELDLPDGYSSSIAGSAEKGFVVTNAKDSAPSSTPSDPVEPTNPNTPSEPGVPTSSTSSSSSSESTRTTTTNKTSEPTGTTSSSDASEPTGTTSSSDASEPTGTTSSSDTIESTSTIPSSDIPEPSDTTPSTDTPISSENPEAPTTGPTVEHLTATGEMQSLSWLGAVLLGMAAVLYLLTSRRRRQ